MPKPGYFGDMKMEDALAEAGRLLEAGKAIKTVVYLVSRVEPVLRMERHGPVIEHDSVSCRIPIAVIDVPPWHIQDNAIEIDGRGYRVVNVGLDWSSDYLIQNLEVVPAISKDTRDLRGVWYASHIVEPHVWPVLGVPEDIEDKAEPSESGA